MVIFIYIEINLVKNECEFLLHLDFLLTEALLGLRYINYYLFYVTVLGCLSPFFVNAIFMYLIKKTFRVNFGEFRFKHVKFSTYPN